jgi:hypothetical protein
LKCRYYSFPLEDLGIDGGDGTESDLQEWEGAGRGLD